MTNEFPQALTIAGSDSGGGAGMQADLKTIQMRHVFATTVVVAVTAQNTLGVQDALALPSEMIDAQFASLAEGILTNVLVPINRKKERTRGMERSVILTSDND